MGGQHQDEGSGNGQEWVSYMDVIRDDLIGEYNTHLKTFGDHKRAMGKTVASGLDGSDESPLLMTAVQTDLVESFLEDVLYTSALSTLEGFLNASRYPPSDLINTLIKHTLDLQSDFPSLRGIVILERIKFIYKGAPLKYLIHDASQDGAIPSKTQDRHIFLNFWDIFSRSWNILKEGLLEDNSAKHSTGYQMLNFLLSLLETFAYEAGKDETSSNDGFISMFKCKGIRSLGLRLIRPEALTNCNPFSICEDMLTYGSKCRNLSLQLATKFIYTLIMIFNLSNITCRLFNTDNVLSAIDKLPPCEVILMLNSFPTYFRAHISALYLEKKCISDPKKLRESLFPVAIPNTTKWAHYEILVNELVPTLASELKMKSISPLIHYNTAKKQILYNAGLLLNNSEELVRLENILNNLDLIISCES